MQPADGGAALGDFNDVRHSENGQTSRFFKRDGKFWIETAGPDGRIAAFEVGYVFGVYPLQQYLLPLAGGRWQAYTVAWDARPKAEGGQRWFSLYPERTLAPGDALHWTGRDMNWNFMCADCHSTGVERRFDLARNVYETRWQEIDVACEACHGPGGHARSPAERTGRAAWPARAERRWTFADPNRRIASPPADAQRTKSRENVCYGCHARRRALFDANVPDAPFLDRYSPQLLEKDVYYPDGQILDEAFEYGSFMQSKMHRAGVACIDCHDPHTGRLKLEGNALCGQCHNPRHYDRAEHARHSPDSEAARCVACHMTGKTYMGVHFRRDHGFRVPSPETAAAAKTPDACRSCHGDKDAAWAGRQIRAWTGKQVSAEPSLALELSAAWENRDIPGIPSTAVSSDLAAWSTGSVLPWLRLDSAGLKILRRAATDDDGLIRLGAARALSNLPPKLATELGIGLLGDTLRAVRIEAANALAGLPDNAWTRPKRAKPLFRRALAELTNAELAAAERPESHVNLSRIYARLNRMQEAEQALDTALRLAPDFVPAWVNLADLYRATGRDTAAEGILRRAAGLVPDAARDAVAAHALGLWLIRHDRIVEALPWLARATALDPKDAGYARVYGLAMESARDRRGLADR